MRSFKRQEGAIIVLAAAVALLFAILISFLIWAGFRTTNRAALRNIANISALAAIDGYSRLENIVDQNNRFMERATAGLNRARSLAQQNTGLFMGPIGNPVADFALGDFPDSDDGGKVEFGIWYPQRPLNNPPAGCAADDNNYPCLAKIAVYSNGVNYEANAAIVTVRTNRIDSFKIPFFSGVFDSFSESATAFVVPRCFANLIDISPSSMIESYPSFSTVQTRNSPCPAGTSKCFYDPTPGADPLQMGLFAFNKNQLDDAPGTAPDAEHLRPSDIRCNVFTGYDDHTMWCSMEIDRGSDTNPKHHYRSDFIDSTGNWQSQAHVFDRGNGNTMYVFDVLRLQRGGGLPDYLGPEPFSRSMLAFNAAARLALSKQGGSDRSLLMAFNGTLGGQLPHPLSGQSMLQDIAYFVQMTNFANRGLSLFTLGTGYGALSNKIFPNPVTRNIFPTYVPANAIANGTNIVEALASASASLVNASGGCNGIASRSIVLSSDGVQTCYPSPWTDSQATRAYTCMPGSALNYANYRLAEDALLTNLPLADELKQRQIRVTILLDGLGVGPNIVNIRRVEDAHLPFDPHNLYLSFEEAKALPAFWGRYFNTRSTCPEGSNCDSNAFQNFGKPAYLFRRPLYTLGQLAFRTDGELCPIMPVCLAANCDGVGTGPGECGPPGECYRGHSDPYYPDKLWDCYRTPFVLQTCSVYNFSEAQQAALCATRALVSTPFSFGEPNMTVNAP